MNKTIAVVTLYSFLSLSTHLCLSYIWIVLQLIYAQQWSALGTYRVPGDLRCQFGAVLYSNGYLIKSDQFQYGSDSFHLLSANYVLSIMLIIFSNNPVYYILESPNTLWGSETVLHLSHLNSSNFLSNICIIVIIILMGFISYYFIFLLVRHWIVKT